MSEAQTKPIDLWTCLHDGILEAVRSELAARTLTFIIDSPFHREFHQLSSDTRLAIVGESVRSVAFDFEPWPNSIEPPASTKWEEAQEQRRRNSEMGRRVSSDWHAFASRVATKEEHIILSAELNSDNTQFVLALGIYSYPHSEWHDVEISADRFRFFVGKTEFSAEAFKRFGDAFWEDQASRKKNSASDNKEETIKNV